MIIKKFFKERLVLFVSVFFPIYIFFLHAPFEMYLTNRIDFWFSLSDFWWLIVLTFAIVFLVFFFIGAILPKKLRDIYSVIAISGGICLYVQGNFLNVDLGTLNGSEIIWSDYKSKFIINACIWIAIILISLVLFFIFKQKSIKVLSFVAVFVLLVQVATLSTLLITGINDELDTTENSHYTITDKNLYTVSKNENVIVLILDMFDNEYMREIITETPEVKDTFKDFTFFDNATGSYSSTCYAISAIVTGQVIGNEESSLKENVDKAYENTNMYRELSQQGYVFDMYTSYSMTPQEVLDMSENYLKVKSTISNEFSFIKRMYRLVVCRFAPDFLKQDYWLTGNEFKELEVLKSGNSNIFNEDNLLFYQGVQHNGLKLTDEKRFKVIPLNGVHYPYLIDENANPIAPTSDPIYALGAAKGVLKIVDTYLDELKENGAYENSTIVLVADHGYYTSGVLTNPLIMVKRANVNSDFTINKAPVSHFDLHATIMDSLGLNDNEKYGKSMFEINTEEPRERLFYQYNLFEGHSNWKFRLMEYSVNGITNERKNFKLTGKEIAIDGTVSNHFENCKYCIENGTDPIDAPNSLSILHEPIN